MGGAVERRTGKFNKQIALRGTIAIQTQGSAFIKNKNPRSCEGFSGFVRSEGLEPPTL
jgi:hypothetical protein